MFQSVILALIQGFTEFLPISSSAHLILPSQLLGWPDQKLYFDVAVHIGTLFAVLIYFRSEVQLLLMAWWHALINKKQTANSKLAWLIILATMPAALFGLLFHDMIEQLRNFWWVIPTTTILFGVLLGYGDKTARQQDNEYSLDWKKTLYIGIGQAIAMIPGTSRSGLTITLGLMLGLTRQAAARFSFLMSIPIILLAGSYAGLSLFTKNNEVINWSTLSVGIFVSFVSAYLCIHLFLKIINKMGMMPFVLYRIILGLLLFAIGFELI